MSTDSLRFLNGFLGGDMLIESLARDASDAAVIFFAGWGMDARPFENIRHEKLGCDLLLLHSYHKQTEQEAETFAHLTTRYKQTAVVGWSFGVALAWELLDACPGTVASFTAVNGTPCPIHARYGIDPRIMRLTIERFGEAGRQAFYTNMCGGEREGFRVPERSTEDLATELVYLQRRFEGKAIIQDHSSLKFPVQAYVSRQDHIMPMKRQISAWEKWQVPCQCVEGPHYNATLLTDVLQQAASHVRNLAL